MAVSRGNWYRKWKNIRMAEIGEDIPIGEPFRFQEIDKILVAVDYKRKDPINGECHYYTCDDCALADICNPSGTTPQCGDDIRSDGASVVFIEYDPYNIFNKKNTDGCIARKKL